MRSGTIWITIAAVTVTLVCARASAASALPRPEHAVGTPAQEARDVLARHVASTLNACPHLTIFDHVSGLVDGAVVTLSGKVTTQEKKLETERAVAGIAGIEQVRSEIVVLAASPSDADLRHRAARAIYSHPAFWSYAAMRRPPIHILVENRDVTLAGTVRTQAERLIARSLVNGLGERTVLNALRVDDGRNN